MMHTIKESHRIIDFILQDPTQWTQKLPSTARRGLIIITGILILILILDALTNRISLQIQHSCITRKRKKKKHKQEEMQITRNEEEPESIWDTMTHESQSEESDPSTYGSMKNNSGQSPLLPLKEENHYVEQEIKDLQGTVKSLQREITTHYPLMQN